MVLITYGSQKSTAVIITTEYFQSSNICDKKNQTWKKIFLLKKSNFSNSTYTDRHEIIRKVYNEKNIFHIL